MTLPSSPEEPRTIPDRHIPGTFDIWAPGGDWTPGFGAGGRRVDANGHDEPGDMIVFSVPPDQALAFGALTLDGAGGVAPTAIGGTVTSAEITSGNEEGHWQIAADGTITPTVAGASAKLNASPYSPSITFHGGSGGQDSATITIDTSGNDLENTAHVVSEGEFDAWVTTAESGSVAQFRDGRATGFAQHGIVWRAGGQFSYPNNEYGRYVNGDFWAVGPVTFERILPESELIASGTYDESSPWANRTVNGTMVNPGNRSFVGGDPNDNEDGAPQAFDSLMGSAPTLLPYDDNSNVDPGNTEEPLIVAEGAVVKSTHRPSPPETGRAVLNDMAVLTVVSEAPAVDAFRPPVAVADKSSTWRESDLDYTILPKLTPTASFPGLETAAARVSRMYQLLHTNNLNSRNISPANNHPEYGRNIAKYLEVPFLALTVDAPDEEKRDTYVGVVQFGIDVYGRAVEGGIYPDLGGGNQWRKLAMVIAGLALDDADIRERADREQQNIFTEDRQIFEVAQIDVDTERYTADDRQRDPYTVHMIGLPEWGEQAVRQPIRSGSNWDVSYRQNVFGSLIGHALVARLIEGVKAAWNNSTFFDYYDRVWGIEEGSPTGGANDITALAHEMWTEYRSLDVPGPVLNNNYMHSGVALTPLSPTSVLLEFDQAVAEQSYQYRLDGGAAQAVPVDDIIPNLIADTTYSVEVRAVNTHGAGPWSFGKDVTTHSDVAPTLTSPSAVQLTGNEATLKVDTDVSKGTIYWVVTQSNTAPSAAQVKDGLHEAGEAADASGEHEVLATGAQSMTTAGLEGGTTYYAYFMHEELGGLQSTVASADALAMEVAPSVEGHANSQLNTATDADRDVTLPDGIEAGELLVIFFTILGGEVITPEGWTLELSQSRTSMFTRIADGTEGSSVSVSVSATTRSAHSALRISFGATLEAVAESETTDPPLLELEGDAAPTLWLTLLRSVGSDWTITDAPVEYTDLVQIGNPSSSAPSRVKLGWARRTTINAVSDNPSAFVVDGTLGSEVTFTIGIRGES